MFAIHALRHNLSGAMQGFSQALQGMNPLNLAGMLSGMGTGGIGGGGSKLNAMSLSATTMLQRELDKLRTLS